MYGFEFALFHRSLWYLRNKNPKLKSNYSFGHGLKEPVESIIYIHSFTQFVAFVQFTEQIPGMAGVHFVSAVWVWLSWTPKFHDHDDWIHWYTKIICIYIYVICGSILAPLVLNQAIEESSFLETRVHVTAASDLRKRLDDFQVFLVILSINHQRWWGYR